VCLLEYILLQVISEKSKLGLMHCGDHIYMQE
jgi:hypothetical protein